jgi:diguanylate cyclase (GGDEF)-like protein
MMYVRISLGLVILTCSILVGLDLAGILPRASSALSESRIQLCDSLAMEAATAAERNDYASIRRMFSAVVQRNEDVMSIGLRNVSDRLLVTAGKHNELWEPDDPEGSTLTHARIPLTREAKRWGTVEVRFQDSDSFGGIFGDLLESSLMRVLFFVGISGFFAYTVYMKRLLRHLDPTSVIPPRVQATLDVMAEGVVLIDRNERIVLANATFAELIDRPSETLIGVKASELGWLVPKTGKAATDLPWVAALEDSERHIGTPLTLRVGPESFETFMVNGAPVAEDSGKPRGAIATFNCISELERKTKELEQALVLLEKSRDETRLRNDELQVLATCDPLTGAVNRRSFMERGELEFETAKRENRELSFIMVDIDHFKLVNDEHGHSMGDEVICRLAQELISEYQNRELVCRFGGEEFCILMTDATPEDAVNLASRLRRSIASEGFAPIPVTASFGVSSIHFGAPRFYDLLNQADEALYASKENGRNQVTRFDEVPPKASDAEAPAPTP